MCVDVCRCTRVCAGMHGYGQVCASVCAIVCRCVWKCAGVCESVCGMNFLNTYWRLES